MTIKNIETRLNKMSISNIQNICKKMKVKCAGKSKKKMIQELMLPISFKYRMKRRTGPKSWKEEPEQKKRKTSPPQPCGICFQRKLHKNNPNIKLDCNHDYHDGCIRPWVVEQGKTTCPLCRAKISDKEQKIIRNYEPTITRSTSKKSADGSDNDSSSDSDSELIEYGAEWWEEQFRTRPEAEVMAEWDRYYGVPTQ